MSLQVFFRSSLLYSNTWARISLAKICYVCERILVNGYCLGSLLFYKCMHICIFPVDEMQVSCYKILNNLYTLGTGRSSHIERYDMMYSTLCEWFSMPNHLSTSNATMLLLHIIKFIFFFIFPFSKTD